MIIINKKIRKKRRKNRPSFPTNKKNHTLPVRLISRGTAYAGLRNKSKAVKIALRNFRFSQLFAGLITEGRGVGEKLTAARRMKGLVSPQAMPTRRKPSVERKIEGGEGVGVGVEVEVEMASIGKKIGGVEGVVVVVVTTEYQVEKEMVTWAEDEYCVNIVVVCRNTNNVILDMYLRKFRILLHH